MRDHDAVIRIVDDDAVIRVVDDDDDVLADGESVKVPLYLTDAHDDDELATFDAADHRSGFRLTSDAERAAVADARDEMIRRMCDAWRGPQRDAADARRKRRLPDDDDDPDENNDEPEGSGGQYNRQYEARGRIGKSALSHEVDGRDGARAARDEYVRRLTDAWRSPGGGQLSTSPRDAAEPDLGSTPEELALRSHLFGAPGLRQPSDPDVDPSETMRGHLGELSEQVQRSRDREWSRYRDNLQNAWRGGRTDPRTAPAREREIEEWKGGRDARLRED